VRFILGLGLAATLGFATAACTAPEAPTGEVAPTADSGAATTNETPAGGDTAMTEAGKIALLLPETKTARYETQDRPLFEAKLKELCPTCELIYSNANQDAATQQQQAEAALTNGAQVLVLDPVDSKAAGGIATMAKEQGVPVVSYDRLILDAPIDYYISFDNEKVGTLQGEALLEQLAALGKTSGDLVMINGAPTDNNAKMFKAGAHSALDASGFTIGAEYDTPDWSPDKAQAQMEQAITALGKAAIVGVLAANDGTAGGAISAMKAAGMDPLPPITGQDAELAAIQRILASEQFMTVYKAIKPEAETAAELALALLRKSDVPAGINLTSVDNGSGDIPSVLLAPVKVTKDNVKDTVLKDAFWTLAQICTTEYADFCKAAGLQ
jgi:D-xylose transport system substrate-binding protein